MDHINGDRADNRFANLRLADFAQSSWNRSVATNNKTGVIGVFQRTNPKTGTVSYIGYIKVRGKRHYVKASRSLEVVQKARLEAEKQFVGFARAPEHRNRHYAT